MKKRKEYKRSGLRSLKKHYFLLVVVCLISAMLGTKYADSLAFLNPEILASSHAPTKSEQEVAKPDLRITSVLSELAVSNYFGNDKVKELSEKNEKAIKEGEKNSENVTVGNHLQIGKQKGALARVYEEVSSHVFLITLALSVCSVIHGGKYALILLILLGALMALTVWFFVVNVFRVASARVFLEARVYREVPVSRIGYLFYVGKWIRASVSMFITTLFLNLWMLTIVGGIIKICSYFAVPYILAENPTMKARQAITLSRNMMDGHKWEYFKLCLSLLGWTILSSLTCGISGVLFSNPYREATLADYYSGIREEAIANGVEGTELFVDGYLYRKADESLLQETYGDIINTSVKNENTLRQFKEKKGFFRFIARTFGVVVFETPEIACEKQLLDERNRIRAAVRMGNGSSYPQQLCPLQPVKEHKKRLGLHPYRQYSLVHMIMMFLMMCSIGWCWEVSLKMIEMGQFVNRGMLHGPWIPIYGTGGVMILLVLYRLRHKPALEFTAAVVLCGFVEYMTSYITELEYGKRWWDYSGYFLNLDGRICAEGLLVFGIMGMLIVYVVAPLLDNMLSRIHPNVMRVVTFALFAFFVSDACYSLFHPNEGKGISSGMMQVEEEIRYAENLPVSGQEIPRLRS